VRKFDSCRGHFLSPPLLDEGAGATHVDLCWVDEVALALIDLAIAKNRALGLVYPAPAGQVAVLVAAQLSPGTT
jgi:hypothetical protein